MRAINLLPKQVVGERPTGLVAKLPFVGAGAVPVIAIALVFVGYSSGHSGVTAKQTQLATLTAQIAATAPVVSVVPSTAPDTAGLVADRAARLIALQGALASEVAWDTTLVNITRVLPANVWLSDLTVTAPTAADVPPVAPAPVATTTTTTSTTTTTAAPVAVPVATPGFTINGFTYNEADVAVLLQRLSLLPTLSDVLLVSTSQSTSGKTAVTSFSISAVIAPDPAVTP